MELRNLQQDTQLYMSDQFKEVFIDKPLLMGLTMQLLPGRDSRSYQ